MNLRHLSDADFQKSLEAMPAFDYDLAAKTEGLKSVSQVPDELWSQYVQFYEDYSSAEPWTTKRSLELALYLVAGGILVFIVLPWAYESRIFELPFFRFFAPFMPFIERYRFFFKAAGFVLLFYIAKGEKKRNHW